MKTISLPRLWAVLLLCTYGVGPVLLAATPGDHWIGTWAASPQAEPNEAAMAGGNGTTYREIVHISAGGAAVRIVVTNEFGLEPLTIGAAQIAISVRSRSILMHCRRIIR
jgi:hypothetical protein